MLAVKETKEALTALNEIALFLIPVLKDGFQLGEDVMAVIAKLKGDLSFIAKLELARQGLALVPQELGDISVSEAVELAHVQMEYLPKLLAAIKGA